MKGWLGGYRAGEGHRLGRCSLCVWVRDVIGVHRNHCTSTNRSFGRGRIALTTLDSMPRDGARRRTEHGTEPPYSVPLAIPPAYESRKNLHDTVSAWMGGDGDGWVVLWHGAPPLANTRRTAGHTHTCFTSPLAPRPSPLHAASPPVMVQDHRCNYAVTSVPLESPSLESPLGGVHAVAMLASMLKPESRAQTCA